MRDPEEGDVVEDAEDSEDVVVLGFMAEEGAEDLGNLLFVVLGEQLFYCLRFQRVIPRTSRI